MKRHYARKNSTVTSLYDLAYEMCRDGGGWLGWYEFVSRVKGDRWSNEDHAERAWSRLKQAIKRLGFDLEQQWQEVPTPGAYHAAVHRAFYRIDWREAKIVLGSLMDAMDSDPGVPYFTLGEDSAEAAAAIIREIAWGEARREGKFLAAPQGSTVRA